MIRILITSGTALKGKTTAQVLLRETLQAMGHKVTCSDLPSHCCNDEKWIREIGNHHKGASARQIAPMNFEITVL